MLFGRRAVEIADAKARIVALERALEKSEHEYGILRADYARLIELLGNAALAKGTQGRWDLGNADPYAEDEKQPDVYLTPGEDEIPDPRKLEEELSPSAN